LASTQDYFIGRWRIAYHLGSGGCRRLDIAETVGAAPLEADIQGIQERLPAPNGKGR